MGPKNQMRKTTRNNNGNDQNNGQHINNGSTKRRNQVGNHQGNNRNVQAKTSNVTPFQACKNCGKTHPGKFKWGTLNCYACGTSGHFSKECPTQNLALIGQFQLRNPPYLNSMQATIDGPLISQGQLEAPVTQAQIYAYINADALASTLNVVPG